MQGFPKWLNTKQDYINIKTNFPEEIWRPQYQALLDTRHIWQNGDTLADGDPGIEDDKNRILIEQDEDGKEIRIQQTLVVDPNAKITRIGMTVKEVKTALGIK